MAMAARLQPRDKRVAIDAWDWGFAGRIDVGDIDDVGIVEAGAEILEQVGEAGIAMGLHNGDHLGARMAADRQPGRFQHRRNLDRVVAVIVDDGDAAGDTGLGEPALDALELGQRAPDRLVVDLHLVRDRDGGAGVLDIVPAQHRQVDLADDPQIARRGR